jgi:hypothetical protein
VDEAAHNRAPVSDRDVPDLGYGVGDRGAAWHRYRIELDIAVAGERSHHQRVGLDTVVLQFPDAVEIDQRGWPRESEVHHRDQALAAGERASVVAQLVEKIDRLSNQRWGVVRKGCRLHAASPGVGSSVMGGVRSARRSRWASWGEAPKAQITPARTGDRALGQYLVSRS